MLRRTYRCYLDLSEVFVEKTWIPWGMVVFEEKFRLSPVTRWEILKTGSETRANQQTRDKERFELEPEQREPTCWKSNWTCRDSQGFSRKCGNAHLGIFSNGKCEERFEF